MELFIGCFGNGHTFCDKSVKEGSDYKKLCHVGETGKVTWYVNKDNLPYEVKVKIAFYSERARRKFEDSFSKMNETDKFCFLADRMNDLAFMHVSAMKGSLQEKNSYMLSVLEETSVWDTLSFDEQKKSERKLVKLVSEDSWILCELNADADSEEFATLMFCNNQASLEEKLKKYYTGWNVTVTARSEDGDIYPDALSGVEIFYEKDFR